MRVAVAVVVGGAVVGRCSFRPDSREAAKLRPRLDQRDGITLIKVKTGDDADRMPGFVRFPEPRPLPAEAPTGKARRTDPEAAAEESAPRQLDLFG